MPYATTALFNLIKNVKYSLSHPEDYLVKECEVKYELKYWGKLSSKMYYWQQQAFGERSLKQANRDRETARDQLYSYGYRWLRAKVRKAKLKSNKYYEKLIKTKDVNGFYGDQAIRNTRVYDRNIMSAYTPYGIRIIDSWYGKEIRKIGTKEQRFTPAELERMVLKNYHLHEVIKWNLIININNYKNLQPC